ncbi:MAG: oligomeric, coiled-coil, peripheral membrane protein [Vezdaea aestivalis]|nr:MAG: oligomeric, coiled-coil, peripheral membrane protein [Vezdaea aestivalis]
MTARGKQVKYSQLQAEEEIFVYDKQLIQPPVIEAAHRQVPQIPVPAPFQPDPPPDQLSSQTELESWQKLFASRRAWALDLLRKCAAIVEAVRKHSNEAEIIERALGVAVSNMGMHVGGLQTMHSQSQNWAAGLLDDHAHLTEDWQTDLERLKSVSARPDILAFIGRKNVKTTFKGSKKIPSSGSSLKDLFFVEEVREASSILDKATKRFLTRLADIDGTTEKVLNSSKNLSESVSRTLEHSTVDTLKKAEELLVDIELLGRKVASDYEHVLGLERASTKSVPQASKLALLHTREYLVNLTRFSEEMGSYFINAVELRNSVAKASAKHLQTISNVQSMLTTLTPQINKLEFGEDAGNAVDLLRLLDRIPAIYGSCLVEAVRRHDWGEKLKAESSKLAEDLAVLRDEEEKRRRKWFRHTGELIWHEPLESNITGVEVNLKGDEKAWPSVGKNDVEHYIASIREVGGMGDVATEVEQLLRDLDKPSKQQAKRIKAFKMGSIHDAAIARSSILSKPDDESAREWNDEKVKLEERLKGSEARVRRLEDILHRTTTMSRNPTGNLFHNYGAPGAEGDGNQNQLAKQPPPVQANTHENVSRRSSVSSKRISLNMGTEDKSLVQRIVTLEAELIAERERSSGLQKEATARRDSEDQIKSRFKEADSTKQDLMKNLEAQKREFMEERKHLEADIQKLNDKLEQAEDEIERVLGSRDHDKSDHAKELEATRDLAATEADKAQTRLETLLMEVTKSRSTIEQVDEQRRRAVEELGLFTTKLKQLEEEVAANSAHNAENGEVMRLAHTRLAPGQTPPQGIGPLAQGIETLALKSANYVKGLESTLAMARIDKEALGCTMQEVEESNAAIKAKLGAEEMESFTLRETLAQERATASVLRSEIEDHLKGLSTLQAQFAEGETGSEILKQHLADQEVKSTALTEELAARHGQIRMTEAELERTQTKLRAMQINVDIASNRQSATATHALEISRCLFAQHELLLKLLMDLGFAVFRQGGSMAVQRASKINASITEAADGNLKRTDIDPKHPNFDISMPPNLVQWTTAPSIAVEASQFEAFLSAVQTFDLDLFCTVIGKRMTQLETIARKAQKDARGYRDRAHRLQRESADKIAYRSFKEGDLALFLPTRNQPVKAWAAFNVGAPHHFLRPENEHNLGERDWLVARITKKDERIVDLKTTPPSIASTDTDWSNNPFDLSDGLRWYLLHATDNVNSAPAPYPLSVTSKSKSTVTATPVAAEGMPNLSASSVAGTVARNLHKSLDSRRSSTNSRHSASILRDAMLGNSSAVAAAHDRETSRGSSRSGTNPAVEAVKSLDLGLPSSSSGGPFDDQTSQNTAQGSVQGSGEVRSSRDRVVDFLFGP